MDRGRPMQRPAPPSSAMPPKKKAKPNGSRASSHSTNRPAAAAAQSSSRQIHDSSSRNDSSSDGSSSSESMSASELESPAHRRQGNRQRQPSEQALQAARSEAAVQQATYPDALQLDQVKEQMGLVKHADEKHAIESLEQLTIEDDNGSSARKAARCWKLVLVELQRPQLPPPSGPFLASAGILMARLAMDSGVNDTQLLQYFIDELMEAVGKTMAEAIPLAAGAGNAKATSAFIAAVCHWSGPSTIKLLEFNVHEALSETFAILVHKLAQAAGSISSSALLDQLYLCVIAFSSLVRFAWKQHRPPLECIEMRWLPAALSALADHGPARINKHRLLIEELAANIFLCLAVLEHAGRQQARLLVRPGQAQAVQQLLDSVRSAQPPISKAPEHLENILGERLVVPPPRRMDEHLTRIAELITEWSSASSSASSPSGRARVAAPSRSGASASAARCAASSDSEDSEFVDADEGVEDDNDDVAAPAMVELEERLATAKVGSDRRRKLLAKYRRLKKIESGVGDPVVAGYIYVANETLNQFRPTGYVHRFACGLTTRPVRCLRNFIAHNLDCRFIRVLRVSDVLRANAAALQAVQQAGAKIINGRIKWFHFPHRRFNVSPKLEAAAASASAAIDPSPISTDELLDVIDKAVAQWLLPDDDDPTHKVQQRQNATFKPDAMGRHIDMAVPAAQAK